MRAGNRMDRRRFMEAMAGAVCPSRYRGNNVLPVEGKSLMLVLEAGPMRVTKPCSGGIMAAGPPGAESNNVFHSEFLSDTNAGIHGNQ